MCVVRPVVLAVVSVLVAVLLVGGRASADPLTAPAHGRWPLQPRPQVVARFEPPASRWGAGHRGVDLLGSPGQPVHSALAGRVRFAGTLAGRGVVVVDHGARRTTYEPVRASVTVGDEIAAGAVIGRLQTGGSHCLPRTCLHWGLIADGPGDSPGVSDGSGGHYLDPLTLVGAGPVRLYPLAGPLAGASPVASWLAAHALLATRPGLPPAAHDPPLVVPGPQGSAALPR